jgi:muramoyltetrapeptide carboxypeptidase
MTPIGVLPTKWLVFSKTVLKPAAVRPGARIAIVSPASPFSREQFDRGVDELRRLGYEPAYDDDVFARTGTYLSGTAALRAGAFSRAWADPSIAALMAVRGGYGSVQLLPLLDETLIRRTPKLFIGYSDNTSLLSWLTCRCGVTALHGPMIEGRVAKGREGFDADSMLAFMQDGEGRTLSPNGLAVVRGGEAVGPLFGGTITQLVASLGTPYAFDPPAGCVLFLEDVNERPYRLDRMLTQLQFAGILSRARALVFGEMRACDEANGQATALDVIRGLTTQCEGPIISGFPSGHTTGPTWTLPLGVRVRVVTAPRPTLVVEESPVA